MQDHKSLDDVHWSCAAQGQCGCSNPLIWVPKWKAKSSTQPVWPGHEAALEPRCSLCVFSAMRKRNGDKSELHSVFQGVDPAGGSSRLFLSVFFAFPSPQ